MAERLEVTVDWLSRYLDLAELPEAIVAAYPDVTHIRIQHARELKPLLKERKTRERVLERANELGAKQAALRADGAPRLDGKAVIRELKAATRTKKAGAGVLHTYQCETTRRPMLEVSRRGRSGLTLRVVPDSGAGEGEILEACKAALTAFGR
jgi:ParB family chromosome partitioning protein